MSHDTLNPITNFDFRIGTLDARNFSEDCKPGDWESFPITFTPAFSGHPTRECRVRVIVTPNNQKIPRGEHNAAVVGIAQNVTNTGFTLAARNSDCARGGAGFNWMAICERSGRTESPIDLRMGVVQPQHFKPDCKVGDWRSWGVDFTDMGRTPKIFLTPTNLNVTPFHTDDGLAYHNAAVVGVVQDPAQDGFTLRGRNSDCAEGDSSFYYVALSDDQAVRSDIFVDCGELGVAKGFQPDCKSGDWDGWLVQFTEPFMAPPVVLVTANDRPLKDGQHNAAVVGIARNVTTDGFTLSARNSDCSTGFAGFYWVAFGCGKGCGTPR